MPLAPRFSWDQDASNVALSVLLPGGALKNADIYVSDLVLKLNAPPYVLLLDLFALVDDASVVVKAVASESLLRIRVQKRQEGLWPTLVCKDSKVALRTRRVESMARKSESEVVLADQRREKRYKEEKQTLRAQMAVDDANRQILQDLKDEEKQREERALYESFKELKAQEQQQLQPKSIQEQTTQQQQQTTKSFHASTSAPEQAKCRVKTKKRVSFASDLTGKQSQISAASATVASIVASEEAQVLELSADGSFDLPATPLPTRLLETNEDDGDVYSSAPDDKCCDDTDAPAAAREAQEALETPQAPPAEIPVSAKRIPGPRAALHSEIQFTPRVFPTPSRESKAAEEEDWLLKNRQHLNKHKGLHGAGSYDISESDPMWLKAKGDDFYRSKDYCGAVNAYSEAFSLAPEQSDLKITCLSNRAAAHLQLYDFDACIADCSTALSFIPDTRESSDSAASSSSMLVHYRLKLKLFVRRGTAYCRVGKLTEAKADYGVALSMDNQNVALHDDFLQLVAVEKAQELKAAGDKCFREQQQLEQAVALYTDSLRLNPLSIACLSNRAACFLVLRAFEKCVEDCTRALELLQQNLPSGIGSSEGQHGLAFFSAGPAAGSVKRRAWVLKTLVRRGAAYAAMEDWESAEVDYAASVELDPTSEALRADLLKVQTEKAGKYTPITTDKNGVSASATSSASSKLPEATSGQIASAC